MESVQLGEIQLINHIMNAAGPWASTTEQIESIYKSSAGAVVTKTFTIEHREGNPEPNQYFGDDFSLNCVGLANRGILYFHEAVRNLGKEKPIIASVAETDIYRLATLISMIGHSVFSGIELNLSCPNVKGKNSVASNPRDLDEYINIAVASTGLPVGVKLPPFTDQVRIFDTARTLEKYRINHLVLSNTLPVRAEDYYHHPPIATNEGMVGLGGKAIKAYSLKSVMGFHQEMPDMPIVGVGGIYDKDDVQDYLNAGALAVQVGTAINDHGIKKLNELAA